MGRYPFMEAVNRYLETMQGVLAESTHTELRRRFKRMNKDMMELVGQRKKDKKKGITTCTPVKMIDNDIVAYIGLLRTRGMKDSGIDHNLDALAGLLRYEGNAAVEKAKARFPQHFPHSTVRRLSPISDGDRAMILQGAAQVPIEDWRRMEAYAMSVLAICAGLRPKELRFARLKDLDLNHGIMHAEEVKGKGRYGEPRDSAINPDGLPFLRRYLQARAKALMNNYLTSDLLFPSLQNLQKRRSGEFSTNGTTDLRAIVKEETGVDYDLRACRRTFGQNCLDEKIPLDSTSRMMGHATTKTTETYYARKNNDQAIAEAQRMWSTKTSNMPSQTQPDSNPPLIGKKEWLPGYG